MHLFGAGGALYAMLPCPGWVSKAPRTGILHPSANPETLKNLPIWTPSSNLANLMIFGAFLKKSTLCHINGHPKQYIPVDTIFNYRFHFGLPGKGLLKSPENAPFWRRRSPVCHASVSRMGVEGSKDWHSASLSKSWNFKKPAYLNT